MHKDRGGLADLMSVYHYTISRQVLDLGIGKSVGKRETTSTWHDMIIPPAPERTLYRRY